MRPGRAQRAPTEWATLLFSLLLAGSMMSAAAAPVPRTLTDQSGKTLTLPAQVNKIVAIPIPLASMVMAIDGGTTRLSGINSAAKSDIDEGLLGRMFPGAAKISTRIAGDNFVPNSEALAASRADLVIQWGDRGEAIIDPIRTLHIPMLTLRYGDSLWAAEWLRLTGAALGKAERGERLAVWFEKHVAKITALGEAVPAKSRPRVLHLTRAREALVAAGKGTSMDGDIRRTGGINLAGELPGFSQISVEQILAWNPDIILLNNFEPGLTPAFVYADPRFVGIKAVREKRVYLFPRGGFRWDPPSQETPLAMEWLYGIFHPQQPATGLRARIAAAYLDLYGYRVTEAEIDQILRLPENGRSIHYAERFGKTTR